MRKGFLLESRTRAGVASDAHIVTAAAHQVCSGEHT